jgi:hypothetical protein
MSRLKVLFITSQNAFQLYGGAETALIMLKKYLEERDIICKLYSYKDDFRDYDIIYLHNVSQFPIEAFRHACLANSLGVKVATSPVFWFSLESFL